MVVDDPSAANLSKGGLQDWQRCVRRSWDPISVDRYTRVLFIEWSSCNMYIILVLQNPLRSQFQVNRVSKRSTTRHSSEVTLKKLDELCQHHVMCGLCLSFFWGRPAFDRPTLTKRRESQTLTAARRGRLSPRLSCKARRSAGPSPRLMTFFQLPGITDSDCFRLPRIDFRKVCCANGWSSSHMKKCFHVFSPSY